MAIIEPLAPLDALAALKARGRRLDPSFAWQDVWQDQHAQALTVARSAGFDILGDIYPALLQGLEQGLTGRDFVGRVRPALEAKGWWGRKDVVDPATGEMVSAQLGSVRRLMLIHDVNMRVSYAAGHWAQFERTKKARPWLRYIAILDDRTRPEHRARHNLCLRVDDPYWDRWAPPCGWYCRCTLQSLSDRDVERMRDQLVFTPPPDRMTSWTNKRTGEVLEIPEGIDPGWAYNPGKAGAQAAMTLQKAKDARANFVAVLADPEPPKPTTPVKVRRPKPVPPDPIVLAERAFHALSPDKDWKNGVLASARRAKASAGADFEKLTDAQAALIRWYTGAGYLKLNDALRSGSRARRDLLFRDAINGALDALPPYRGAVRRGVWVQPSEIEAFLALYRPGSVIRLPAFTSTSTAAGFGGNVRYTIALEEGHDVAPISLHPSEAEILVKAGTKFRVVKVDRSSEDIVIMLKEIGKRKPRTLVAQAVGGYVPSAADLDAIRLCSEDLVKWRDAPPGDVDSHMSRKMQSGGWGEASSLDADEE